MEALSPKPSDSPTILLVDDDQALRLITRYVLARYDYNLIEATNGEEALELFEQHRPNLLLLDAIMPGIDGFEVCARLREQGDNTPVLMVTGLDDDQSVESAFAAGANDYITKPVQWAVLRHRVARIIQAHQLQKRIAHLAYRDTLTGLPNRQLFTDRLSTALAHARRAQSQLALVFIDLDNFKTINDTLGHAQGDELLRAIADRLTSCMREADTVARLGGDEFIVLLEGISSSEDASIVADKILTAINRPLRLQGRDIVISASIGIALYPSDGHDPGTLLKNADVALYRVKDQGRANFQFYAREIGELALRRMLLTSSLHKAVANEQFLLHYQPRFNLKTGKLLGVEALLRWQHPELGLLYPDEFIPLAEEIGLLPTIGDWVLRQACTQGAAWQAQGFTELRVACNLHNRQIIQPTLIGDVQQILANTGFDGRSLELEVREDATVRNTNTIRKTLRQLHDLGIKLTLDDFGDGHSALSYLTRLPLSTLKISRSFIKSIPEESADTTIVKVVASVAQHLDLRLAAEGVETKAQQRFLSELGCNEAQGFIFDKPRLAKELDLTRTINLVN